MKTSEALSIFFWLNKKNITWIFLKSWFLDQEPQDLVFGIFQEHLRSKNDQIQK
jgi:hypothetical protein